MIQIGQPEHLQVCYALRHEVFGGEQHCTAKCEVGALDTNRLHLLTQQEGTPVATAHVHTNITDRVVLGAQAYAIGFYTKLSFERTDEGEPLPMMEQIS
ncbi:MAG: hypothetical protein V7695_05580 [Sulfitobacter sp.]